MRLHGDVLRRLSGESNELHLRLFFTHMCKWMITGEQLYSCSLAERGSVKNRKCWWLQIEIPVRTLPHMIGKNTCKEEKLNENVSHQNV